VKALLTVLALAGLGWAALPVRPRVTDGRVLVRREAALFIDAVKSVWPPRPNRARSDFPSFPHGWIRYVGRRHSYVDASLPESVVLRIAPRLAPLITAGRVEGGRLVSFLCGPLPRALADTFPNGSTLVVVPPWRRLKLPPGCGADRAESEAR
jgi:hypothetical protein